MIKPMLAEKAPEPFDSERHFYEVKYDGARCIAYVKDGQVRFLARSGNDHTAGFPELSGLPRQVQASEAILDGELIVEDGDGHNPSTSSGHSFRALQSRIHRMNELAIRVAAQAFPATLMHGLRCPEDQRG